MMRVKTRTGLYWLILPLLLLGGDGGSWAGDAVPRSPRDSQGVFELADRSLVIELAAAEPEVTSPVAIAWDEDGRLYVAEMLDYPVGPAPGRIRRLEDRDNDGRYEHATVFADNLPFPNSVLPSSGGVLVTAAPNIWYLRDRAGAGRADLRRVLLTGFGEGNTQLRVNGLAMGLDNRIYAANGRSDGEVRSPGDPAAPAVSIRRRDVRFALTAPSDRGDGVPRVTDVEAIAGSSQFGLAHDDWGNRFPSWNTVPLRHVVIEQQALDRNPYLADTSSVASILDMTDGGRIFTISPAQARFNRESVAYFNASCGPLIERGGALPERYRGNALVCEPLTNLVHRRVLEPAGATFIARRGEEGREFLASSDPCFRPVNLATGPDGALYVVDMYRELVEHPQFVPDPARASVDFRRWHDRGRIWRIRPREWTPANRRQPNLSRAAIPQLVALLGDANAWWRATAQRLLVERLSSEAARNRERPAAIPLLSRLARDQSASPIARLHAVYTLHGLDSVDAAILNMAAEDVHPALREHAIRLARSLESRSHQRVLSTPRLAALAADPSIRVRLETTLALGDRCGDEPAALDALGAIAAKDASDPWMRLAILSGLAESALEFIARCDQAPPSDRRTELLKQTAAIVGVRRRIPELGTLLERAAAKVQPRDGRESDSFDGLTLLAGLALGLERSGASLSALIASAPPGLSPALNRLAPLWRSAAAVALSSEPIGRRLLAIDLLARGRPELAETVIPRLLESSQPADIQIMAAHAVAHTDKPALARRMLERSSQLTVAARRELVAALAGSPTLAETLIQALESQMIAASELDASTRDALAHVRDRALGQRAGAVLSRFTQPRRDAVIARYKGALALAADPRRGEAIFARNCQTCHLHQGRGHKVGPDLSGVAGRAGDALLVDILDPNRDVEADFLMVSIATRGGRMASGLLAEETASTLKLRRADAVDETVLRSEIDQIRSTGQSLMPEGLEQAISVAEMADLIAFLREGGRVISRP
jgi:putative membrane-bound dehydrogenase-like protein